MNARAGPLRNDLSQEEEEEEECTKLLYYQNIPDPSSYQNVVYLNWRVSNPETITPKCLQLHRAFIY